MKIAMHRLVRLFLVALASLPFAAGGQDFDRSTRTILVSGATGTQGGAVARELNARGYRVRGLTRDPNSERAREMTALGIEMVQGDFDDPESLDRALAGAYGAFSVQQYRGVGVDGEIRQGKAFADAAKRAGVQHFVYTSVAKATLDTGVPQFESKLLLENYIRSLDIPFTIIRPASFMATFEEWREDAENGRVSGPLPASLERVFIAPQDIGRFVAEAFDHPEEWLGRAEAVAGQKISYGEVAASMGRALGHPVEYYQIPWDEFTATAAPTAVAREGWYLENSDPIDVDALRARYPWLMTLEQYLRSRGWGEAD